MTGSLADLRKVSVWEGRAPAASTAGEPSPVVGPAAAPPSAPDPSRRLPALLALAALLAAAIATAAAVASSSRWRYWRS